VSVVGDADGALVASPGSMQTCSRCGETKELVAFGFRNQAAGRRHKRCKTCVAEYGKQHYAENRQAYISRNGQQSRQRTLALKAQVWRYLAEHPCVDCGETNSIVLEFDHVDPARKLKTI
jgi:ArsR family metal-binding transcriptional regulator